MAKFVPVALGLLLAACTQFPELEALEGEDVQEGDFPRLVPLQDILDAPPPTVSREIEQEVGDRVAALRAKADRLTRNPVIDAETRKRMEEGVQTVQ